MAGQISDRHSSLIEHPEVVPEPDAEPLVHTIFESSTGTWQWVVADPTTKSALIIDPVLDLAPRHAGISTTAADRVLEVVRHNGYRVVRILETHGQREFATAAWYLRSQLRDPDGNMPRICTGKSIAGVQRMFARQYKIQDAGWSRHFDGAFRDGQQFNFGHTRCQVLQLDGNCFAFVIGHNVFLGEVPNESLLRRLSGYTNGYCWHPGGGDLRPTTAQTTTSQFTTPRPSLSVDASTPYSPLSGSQTKRSFSTRPPSSIHEMAG